MRSSERNHTRSMTHTVTTQACTIINCASTSSTSMEHTHVCAGHGEKPASVRCAPALRKSATSSQDTAGNFTRYCSTQLNFSATAGGCQPTQLSVDLPAGTGCFIDFKTLCTPQGPISSTHHPHTQQSSLCSPSVSCNSHTQ